MLEKIGGFDNQLQWGYAFEDDLFLHNVQKWAKLFIVPPERLHCINTMKLTKIELKSAVASTMETKRSHFQKYSERIKK